MPRSASGQPTRIRWRVIALLAALYTINGIDRISLSVGLPLISREFALSATVQGLVLSSFFWTYCGCQIPGGWLADRLGARRTIGFSTALWGLCQCAAGAATSGWMLLITRVGLGVFEAPFMPTASRLTAAWLRPTERASGVTLIDSGAALGSAFGGLVVSALIGAFGSWRIAFLCVGLLTLGFGAVVVWYMRDRPELHRGVNRAEAALIAGSRVGVEADGPDDRHMSGRTYAAMLAARVGWAMIFFGLLTWGPNYLSAARGMSIQSLGLATFYIFLAGAAGEILSGYLAGLLQRYLSRNLAFKVLFGISGLGALSGLAALPYIGDASVAVAILSGAIFFHFFGGLHWTIPAMLAPRDRIGLVGGVMNFAGTSSGIVVPILVGFIVDRTGGYDAVLQFFAGCALLYLVGSLLIDFRPPRARRDVRAMAA